MALDKYTFRIPVDRHTKENIETFFETKGKRDRSQPFYGTLVLTDADTSYIIVNITPSSEAEDLSAKQLFSIPGADLISIIRLEDGQEPRYIEDNRELYPTNTNWSLKVSSK